MKPITFLLLMMSSLWVPCVLHAQATHSIPLGKHIGLDTHIPLSLDTSVVERTIERQLQKVRQQAQAQPYALRQQGDLRLTQDDITQDNEYVITPEGNILKGSWQACQYFHRWEKQQRSHTHQNLEVYQTQREMVLLMLGLSDEICSTLAQQQEAAEERLYADGTLPSESEAATVRAVPTGTVSTTKQSTWQNVTDIPYTGHLSARKAKRYLKNFMKEHAQEVSEALAVRERGERLRPGQRRLLSGYESLCALYRESVGYPAEVCRN